MQQRLRYLLLLRLLAVSGQVLALLLTAGLYDVSLPWWPVGLVLAVLLGYTAYSWQHLPDANASSDGAILRQLLVDIAALSVLVYFTGGPFNPFITLFLLPITFAAASLPLKSAGVLAGLAIVAYTLLMLLHQPLPDQALHHSHQHDTEAGFIGSGFDLHLWGMWYGFILSAALLVFVVSHIGRALHERDAALARAREAALRNEQLIALGSLAAGTAHELGTPLATMAVLVKDMQADNTEPEIQASLMLLRDQIDRCKKALAGMAENAGQLQADAGRPLPLNIYLDEVISEWQTLRDGVTVAVDWRGLTPTILTDRTLTQALHNVLHNAADAAATQIAVQAECEQHALQLIIIDNGQGLSAATTAQIGKLAYSSKSATDNPGMGLGLFLARTTLQRFGGNLEIRDHENGGTQVNINLPLQSLLTTAS